MGARGPHAQRGQKQQTTGCGCKDNCPYNGGGDGKKIVCLFKAATTTRVQKICSDHPEYKHKRAA